MFTVIIALAAVSEAPGPLPPTGDRPPAEIQPFLSGSKIEPTQLEWVKLRFSESEADRNRYRRLIQWAEKRRTEEHRFAEAQLKSAGVEPTALVPSCYRDELCAWIDAADQLATQFETSPRFFTALSEAKPVFAGYMLGIAASRSALEDQTEPTVPNQLFHSKVADQTGRHASQLLQDLSEVSKLSADGKQMLDMLIWHTIERQDARSANTLAALVSKHGWPKKSEVGTEAARDAWLLAQHASATPALQLRFLRLMESHLKDGEVNPKHYAYFYDRVMLSITGKQRYGTQFVCRAARMAALPLEDPGTVNVKRASVGMGTLEAQVSSQPKQC